MRAVLVVATLLIAAGCATGMGGDLARSAPASERAGSVQQDGGGGGGM